jgi:hypothetical protein
MDAKAALSMRKFISDCSIDGGFLPHTHTSQSVAWTGNAPLLTVGYFAW